MYLKTHVVFDGGPEINKVEDTVENGIFDDEQGVESDCVGDPSILPTISLESSSAIDMELHIVHNETYRVPVLLIQAHRSGKIILREIAAFLEILL